MTTPPDIKELSDALRNGQQCDEDGVMCIVSRQACHEAADQLDRIRSGSLVPTGEVEKLREALRECAYLMEQAVEYSVDCGDPYAECPMQDCHNPGNMKDTAAKARAALSPDTTGEE